MAHNRYYIVNADDPNLSQIEGVIVGNLSTQRYSIDGSQIVVKLYKVDHSDYPFLADYEEYSHDQILPVMETDNWLGTIVLLWDL